MLETLISSIKAEGEAEGKQEAVLKVLSKKFTDVPRAVEEKILAIRSAERLDEILLAVMDMASIGEVEAILS